MVKTTRTTLLNFRIPNDLSDKLKAQAQARGKTLTSVAVAILRNALIQPDRQLSQADDPAFFLPDGNFVSEN